MRWECVRANARETRPAGALWGPGKRWGHTLSSVNGGRSIYVFGGFYGPEKCHSNDVFVFDTVERIWSKPLTKGVPPSPRDSHSCTSVGNMLFIFGGTDGMRPLKDLHILDTSTNTWLQPTLHGNGPDAREGHSAALVDRRLFIFGGCGKLSDNSGELYYNDLYMLNTVTLVWEIAITSGRPPTPRDSHTCSAWRNKIIVLGGEDSSDCYLSDVYILDTDTLSWKQINTSGHMLAPRAGHTTVAVGSRLFVFGGFTDDRNLYDDLHVLDLETYVWNRVGNLNKGPSARFSVAGDCLNENQGILVFMGGCNKYLEALDDMYYLYIGTIPNSLKRFKARVTNVNQYGFMVETVINGKRLQGVLFSGTTMIANESDPYPNKRVEVQGGFLSEFISSPKACNTNHTKAKSLKQLNICDGKDKLTSMESPMSNPPASTMTNSAHDACVSPTCTVPEFHVHTPRIPSPRADDEDSYLGHLKPNAESSQ